MSVTLPGLREVCMHEASHASSLIFSGMPPVLTRVDVWPGADLLGATRPDWDTHGADPPALREVLSSVLAGPILDAEPELDSWPIRPDTWADGNRKDGEQAAFLAGILRLDQVDYLGFVSKADTRSRDRRFRALVLRIAAELERVSILFQTELVALAEGVNECA